MITRCPHCLARVRKSPSSVSRVLVLGLVWTVTMALVFGVSVIGPFVMVLLPVFLFGGIGLWTAAYEYAHGDRICPACGKAYEIDGEAVEPAPRAVPVHAKLAL